jgi:hypothetical protein
LISRRSRQKYLTIFGAKFNASKNACLADAQHTAEEEELAGTFDPAFYKWLERW